MATFGTSGQTTVDLEGITHGFEVNSIVFEKDASIFTFDLFEAWEFLFTGAGIINNSGQLQSFLCEWVPYNVAGYPDSFEFFNNATAGELTQFTIEAAPGGNIFGGELIFWNFSTAGSAVIDNVGGAPRGGCCAGWAVTYFEDDSSAGNATIINEGGGLYTHGLSVFEGNSTAGNATIVNNGALTSDGSGGVVEFTESSDTGDSTITCNGDTTGSENPASVVFHGALNGSVHPGRARIILLGTGKMDVAGGLYPLEVTVGSIEGNGNVFLGDTVAVKLLVGSNNLSTTFDGVIQDNPDSSGGSFIKIGTGTLMLTGANTYTGGTIVQAGRLL